MDPNSVEPHLDVIRFKLSATMTDENLPAQDREAARSLYEQLYPPSSSESRLEDLRRRGVS